jgi:hypothetical protein
VSDTEGAWLEHARARCDGTADILSELISRYASSKAKDSAFTDQRALRQTIEEIASLRAERDRQTEVIITLRQDLKEAKARNTMYLSKIQEHEAREY